MNGPIIRIGTSGYKYNDWVGNFYPVDLPQKKWLEFYAQYFDSVEVNFTYYSLPNPYTFYHMAQKTPDNFEFVVKMNQQITHQMKKDENVINTMQKAIQPLIEQNKFGGFLIQFPYKFKYSRENTGFIKWIGEKLSEFDLFFEFRNVSWQKEDTFEYLDQNGYHYVIIDEPTLKGLPKSIIKVTGNIAYLRLHGRNKEKWWQGNNQERYDYLYSKNELEEWFENISNILKLTYKTFIFFNNHPQGKAIKNALMAKEMVNNYL